MYVNKAFVNSFATPDHAPYNLIKLGFCCRTFFDGVAGLLIRTALVSIDDNSTHLLGKYHLFRRKQSSDCSHLKTYTIKKPLQVKFFVNLNLSIFNQKSVAFASYKIFEEAQ